MGLKSKVVLRYLLLMGEWMHLFKIERRDSPISGSGVFACENIPKGSLIIGATLTGGLVTDERNAKRLFALSEEAPNDRFLRVFHRSCIRLIGRHFSFSDSLLDTDYLNHSFEPNMLFAFAHCIARRDIAEGEELTIDYRLILSEGDSIGNDMVTGKEIKGFGAIEVIRTVSRELEAIFAS
jgi:SET domain-containing protein